MTEPTAPSIEEFTTEYVAAFNTALPAATGSDPEERRLAPIEAHAAAMLAMLVELGLVSAS